MKSVGQGGRLSLDLRAEFPQAEGFSWSNLYKIRKWYLFYSSQIEFLYQAGTKLQKVDNATTPMPDLLQFVPWRHQTVIVSKCDTINAAMFYLNKVIEGNMSRTFTFRQLTSCLEVREIRKPVLKPLAKVLSAIYNCATSCCTITKKDRDS